MGRGGVSILSNLGLPELVARDAEQYVRIAAELASDLPRLSKLRATLRERMQSSPLMDAPRFARNVEAAYREMWRRWCSEQRLCQDGINPYGVAWNSGFDRLRSHVGNGLNLTAFHLINGTTFCVQFQKTVK